MKTTNWKIWLSLILIASSASWMVFDGTRAFVLGDYITPQTGDFAGQLGPWSNLVKAIGIEPRSLGMKLFFIAQGFATLIVVMYYVFNKSWARSGLLVATLLGLWYLPIGTLLNLTALILQLLPRRKTMPPRPRYEMPDFIQDALHKRGLMEAYLARPPYQRNDYIGWITRARLNATKQKRLRQMLDELKKGDVYMKMEWKKNIHSEVNISSKT
jgi:Bacteriocin-protection, YdeI or OmpD-Associated